MRKHFKQLDFSINFSVLTSFTLKDHFPWSGKQLFISTNDDNIIRINIYINIVMIMIKLQQN